MSDIQRMDIPMAETNGVITVLVVINYQSFTVYSYLQASPFHLFKKNQDSFLFYTCIQAFYLRLIGVL